MSEQVIRLIKNNIVSASEEQNYSEEDLRVYHDLNLESAAEGIFKALDDNLKKKYTPKNIFNIIKNTDKNKDGYITSDEAKGDIDNIFGLKSPDNKDNLDRIQAFVDKDLELVDIRGLRKGLDVNKIIWHIAKSIIIKNTDKQKLIDMFSNKAAMEYYCKEIGTSSESNKRLSEVCKACDLDIEDIKGMGFSDEVLRDMLKFYSNN